MIFYGGITFGVIVGTATWMGLLYFVFKRIANGTRYDLAKRRGVYVMMIVALLPALAVTAVAFEDQIVPDAKCSYQSKELSMGSDQIVLRPAYRALIERTRDDAEKPDTFRYSHDLHHKESLRDLCDRTRDGRVPMHDDRVMISRRELREAMSSICSGGTGQMLGFCRNYAAIIVSKLYRIWNVLRYPHREDRVFPILKDGSGKRVAGEFTRAEI